MTARIDEIEAGVHRLSVFVPEVTPVGFTFNAFLVGGDEPLLFHAGQRRMFSAFEPAVRRILPPEALRWVAFGHVEADECGAMNAWLEQAPQAQVAHGRVGCDVSVADLAIREPRPLDDGDVIEAGDRRFRYFATPHVPHGWDAGVLFEETTGTLFCGDLFTSVGDGPALTEGDIVGPAIAAEQLFQAPSLGPNTAPTLRRLAALKPKTLAVMHGPSFRGDGEGALLALADWYAAALVKAISPATV
jgi:flavorubredoxin